jgi:hypothetical protein
MKQIYLFLLIGFLYAFTADAQAPRRVLVEDFTQASCPPCAVLNPAYHAILFTPGNETKSSLLCYQTSWPGVDPMNSHNPTEVASRVSYYGVQYVPYSVADGGRTEAGDSLFHDNIGAFAQSVIDERAAVTSPIELTVNHDLRVKLDSVTITVSAKNVSATDLPDVYTLQTVLIEKTITFGNPPGSNGERNFYSVMRKMIPNASGTKLGGLAAGATKDFSFTIAIPTYIYSLRNLGAIAFVQNTSKKEIMQSAESLPKPLPAGSTFLDLEATSEVIGYTGWCDPNVTFKVNYLNAGTDSIKTISIDLILNNIKSGATKIDTVNLAAGGTAVHEFKNINLKAGTKNLLNFRINNVNGSNGKEMDKLNQTSANKELLSLLLTPYATEMHEDFEVPARGTLPPNSYYDNKKTALRVFPANQAWVGGPDQIGGYGNSQFSLWWEFFAAPDNVEVDFMYDKLDLTNSTNTHLTLTRAFAQLNNEPTRLTIDASRDCGITWTTVYLKEGSDLANVAPRPFNYWVPLAHEWVSDTVSMTDFDGAPEVIIRLRGFNPPGGSNFMYLDDINIAQLVVGTKDFGILSGLNVYPNPASDLISVVIESKEAAEATIQLYDMHGKAVGVLGTDVSLREGVNVKSYNVNQYQPGLYSLKISTGKGVINTMISIH